MNTSQTITSPVKSHEPNPNDRSKYSFENNWFEVRRGAWETITKPLADTPVKMLEIGAFEGASTTWMLDNLARHPEARLISVDTFEGGIDYKVTDMERFQDYTLEMRFDHNVNLSHQRAKLTKVKSTSEEALLKLRAEGQTFDLIYIDGSHVALDVLTDAVLSWPMLNQGGLMVFDDLHWKMYEQEPFNPGPGIISFVRCAAPCAQATEAEGQLWVQKVAQQYAPRKAQN